MVIEKNVSNEDYLFVCACLLVDFITLQSKKVFVRQNDPQVKFMSAADAEPDQFKDSSQPEKEICDVAGLLERRGLGGDTVRCSGEDCHQCEAGVSIRGQSQGHRLPGQTQSPDGNVPGLGSELRGAWTHIFHNVRPQPGKRNLYR